MKTVRRYFFFAGLMGLVCWLVAAPAMGDETIDAVLTERCQLTIREDGAVVRETYRMTLNSTSSVVRFPGLVAEANLSSFSLIDRRGDLRLAEWWRSASPSTPALTASAAGRGVVLSQGPAMPTIIGDVEAVLVSSMAGTRDVDVIYAMTGLTWSAGYDVLLRGELANVTNLISVDVNGWIEIQNTTMRSFSRADVVVIGPDTLGVSAPVKEPGILELDDNSPLADLWRFQKPEPTTSHVYPLPSRWQLPAQQTIRISHVAVSRKPVERLFIVRAEEIPTDTRSGFAQPSQIIQFKNAADYGGGRSVPPGPAIIHLGSQRVTPYQRAWFKHTPLQGDIRIDMGKLDGVRVRRVDRGRVAVTGRGYEQSFELRIENSMSQKLQLFVDEQPPVNLAWSLLRSSHPHDKKDRRIVFQPEVAPQSEMVIQYTIRVVLPSS